MINASAITPPPYFMAACPGPIPISTIPTWHLRLFYYCHRHLPHRGAEDCTPLARPSGPPMHPDPGSRCRRVHCCCLCCCCDYYWRSPGTDPIRESTRSLHYAVCDGAAKGARAWTSVLCWSPLEDSRDVPARSPRRSSRTGPCRVLGRVFAPVLGRDGCGDTKRLQGGWRIIRNELIREWSNL